MLNANPVIALVGDPAWSASMATLLRAHDLDPLRCDEPARFIDHLLARYPALVLVDTRVPDWQSWITALKTEQATRRVPALVIGPDSEREMARGAGANDLLLTSISDANLIATIRARMRTLDAEARVKLDCQCREPLSPLAQDGVRKFNTGAYYAQHDVFEALWMAEAGPVRDLYRVILQVGVAYYHIKRGNHAGGLKMLRRSAQWFARLPDECQTVDVRQLREDARRVRDALEAIDPAARFDYALLKPVKLLTNR